MGNRNMNLLNNDDDNGGRQTAQTVKNELAQYVMEDKAAVLPRYFQVFPGGYGEGDRFMGVMVPDQRKVARKYYRHLTMDELAQLLQDPVHECRLTALFMMVYRYERSGSETEKAVLIQCYLDNLSFVNNWDLVDSSAYQLLGPYLEHKERTLLYELAASPNLWVQRVAIIATLYFIRQHDFEDTLTIAERLIDHPHDLIHKAVGWMLREVGKRNLPVEVAFLDRHHRQMNRTTLRYAIEKFEPAWRERYLAHR